MKKTVMAFGTFDLLHPGHINFLKQAKKQGDCLIVIIARDSTVKCLKGKLPEHKEIERLKAINSLNLADMAVLGSLGDKYGVIRKYRPDIICLGYDQKHFVEGLKLELKKFPPKADQHRAGKTKIIRLKPFKPNKYKTSIIKNEK